MQHVDTSRLGRRIFGVAVLLLLQHVPLVASAADPVPEFYGFYAVDGGKLIELKESATESPSVGPGVRFINFSKGGYVSGDAHVSRALYLRHNVNPDAKPAVSVVSRWYVSQDTTRDVELRGKPITGQPEMLMLVPREPLKEGAYTVVIKESQLARFFVNKESVIRNLQTSDDCVDHVYESMKEGSFSKLARLTAGGSYAVVRCARSDAVAHESTQATSASGSTAAPAIAAAVPSTRSAGYQNCISLGTPATSCNILYPIAAQQPGAASSVANEDAGSQQAFPVCVPAPGNEQEPRKWESRILDSFPRDVPRPAWAGSYGDARQLYQLDLWRDSKGLFGEFRNPVLEADSPTSRLYDVKFDPASGVLEFRVRVPVEDTWFTGTLRSDSVVGTLKYRDVTEVVEWQRRPDVSPPNGPDDLYWSRAQFECAMTLWHRY